MLPRCLLPFAVLLLATLGRAAELDPVEQRMVEFIDRDVDAAIDLLEETVNIGSGTMNHEGVRRVGEVMMRELDEIGLATEWIEMPEAVNRAGHLFARNEGSGKTFLLIGHLDTVFESDDEFQAFTRDGDIAQGPGVADMKSGNVVIVHALRALRHVGALDDLSVIVAYTGDEEKSGRPLSISRRDLIEAGREADIALGFEGATYSDGQDWATIARRSAGSWMLEVTGRQAHSSGVFSDRVGAGAINEAARILDSFYGEVRGEYGLTFNAGTIQGGTNVEYDPSLNRGTTFGKTNVVPRRVVVHGGIRTLSTEQLERSKARMRAIVANHLPQTSATISFTDSYPPMSPTDGNRHLAEELSAVNEALGRGPMGTWDPLRRGAADVSFVAPYTDALAGLGAIGDGAHTPNETLELSSMGVAIKRAAILIYRLAQQ